MRRLGTVLLVLLANTAFAQGPYAPNAETAGTDAIYHESELFISWASEIDLIRGHKDIANKSLGKVNFGDRNDVLGRSNKSAVSLGDSGIATVSFDGWVLNGSGPDFAVFENSFNNEFLELAFVEVSKDGKNFVRFPAYSETPANSQIGSFDLLDATNLKNLAGKYKLQYGTPFDLDDVGIDSVKYIRVVDVIGSIDSSIASKDVLGRIINDPYPTDFQNNGFYTGGFDLEAVGLINYDGKIFLNSEPAIGLSNPIKLFPNPAISSVAVECEGHNVIQIQDISGKTWVRTDVNANSTTIDVSELPKGLYQVSIKNEKNHFVTKLLVQ